MNDLQRYTIGQDEPQPEEANYGPRIQYTGQTYGFSTNAGVVTETVRTVERAEVAELNPHHGDGTFASTARQGQANAKGTATELLPSTWVTIDGMEAEISSWVSMGRLQKTSEGAYVESTATAPESQVDTADILPIASRDMDAINAILAPLEQSHADGLAAVGAGVASGKLDPSALVHKFSQVSGNDAESSSDRVRTLLIPYQAQADAALTRGGISKADHSEFWDWARVNCSDELQAAVIRQVHTQDVSGYRSIMTKWIASNPPSIQAIRSAGYPTKKGSMGEDQVFVDGSWMTPASAAKAGFI